MEQDNKSDLLSFSREPRYDLTDEELNILEQSLVDEVERNFNYEPGVYPVWISPESPYSNIPRATEATFFPEVKELDAEVEENTLFMALVDTRDDSKRVIHAVTLSGPILGINGENVDQNKTGFYTVDDLIDVGNFSVDDFRKYYQDRGIDLSHCFSVDTNFRVGERAERFNGMNNVDIAYLAIFMKFIELGGQLDKSGIFASNNKLALKSFERIGIDYELLMGRDDLITSEAERGLEYFPIFIPFNEKNLDIFGAVSEYPQMSL